MAAQVTNYQCPACTGPLQFDAGTDSLICEYCGSSYKIEEIEAMFAKENEEAAQAKEDSDKKREEEQQQAEENDWDTSGMSDDWGADAEGMRVYNCPSCGAQLICDETTAATACPYCDNPTIVPGQFVGVLKPDYVIPFKLKKEQAIAALKKHYEGKVLLPAAFKNQNHLEEIKGVYVPFWLFDGEAAGDMSFEATRTHTYTQGDYRITETLHYHVEREGSIAFAKIPVDGSKKMPDDYMDSLEPFDYNELKPFSNAYLPGYLAEKHSVSAEESMPRAEERAKNTALSLIRADAIGYETLTTKYHNVQLERGKVYYALLPVYMLTTKFQGQNYLFAMNGQTGKFIGNLPVDNGKYWTYFLGIAGGVTALLAVILTLLF